MGANPVRLGNELERLALWAGEGGEVSVADLDAMIADTSEAAVWSLSDALLERDPARALEIGERLIDQGENVTGLIYGLASRLRKACAARRAAGGGGFAEAGRVEPWDAPLRGQASWWPDSAIPTSSELREATEALADLEVWCRGGADYGDELALTLALRRAVGAAAYYFAAAASRAALDFLRAPVLRCRAPFCTALSIFETRARCSASIALASPPSTALSRRRKWVFTVLVSSRFSVRSRSLRRIRFFCEAMLAMSRVPEQASCRPRAAADYSD